jgi:hypothetical protein
MYSHGSSDHGACAQEIFEALTTLLHNQCWSSINIVSLTHASSPCGFRDCRATRRERVDKLSRINEGAGGKVCVAEREREREREREEEEDRYRKDVGNVTIFFTFADIIT